MKRTLIKLSKLIRVALFVYVVGMCLILAITTIAYGRNHKCADKTGDKGANKREVRIMPQKKDAPKKAKSKKKSEPAVEWRNRIVGYDVKPANQFLANPGNFRRHPGAQREALTGLLSEVGWVGVVIENQTTGHVIDGHCRIEEALTRNEEESIPFIKVQLSESEESLVLATFDPISVLATTDKDALDALLRDVSTGNAALLETISDFAEKNRIISSDEKRGVSQNAEVDIDKAEELNQKWQVQHGDLWLIGDHRLLCGDSLKMEDVDRLLAGKKADMVFTDPPYGVNYRSARGSGLQGDLSQATIPISFKLIVESAVTKDARLYFCGGVNNCPLYFSLFDVYCKQVPHVIVWVKEHFLLRPTYHSQYELIYFGWLGSGGKDTFWFGDRTQSDVWQIKRDNSKDYLHPTQKPVQIPMRAIGNSSPPQGIVYEPFAGSGSTILASENLKRKCLAIEKDPKYMAVCLERMSTAFPGLEVKRIN